MTLHKKIQTLIISVFLLFFATISSHAADATFSWITNSEPVSGYKIYYGTSSHNYTSTVDVGLPESVNGNISATVSGLVEGNTYYFAATAYSATEESDYSVEVVHTLPGAAPSVTDTTAPSRPSGLSASATSSSQINLSWTASTDNVGVTGYKIYRGETYVATSAGTSYTNTGLTAATSYSFSVSAIDAAGNESSQSYSASATTQAAAVTPAPTVSTSIWGDTFTPAVLAADDTAAVELGVKFQSEAGGYIKGLRFYKGPGNTGTHTGSLWSAAGQLIAKVTFTNETASGWQYQEFSTPVAITANTTYVASYHTSVGRFSVDWGYFSESGHSNSPLRTLGNGQDGVYLYGAGGFPNQTWNNSSSNYWVDVVFTPTSGGTVQEPAPTILRISSR